MEDSESDDGIQTYLLRTVRKDAVEEEVVGTDCIVGNIYDKLQTSDVDRLAPVRLYISTFEKDGQSRF